MNRLTYRDKVNRTFEQIFAEVIAEEELERGEIISDSEKARLKEIAWREYQLEIKRKE